MASSAPHPEDHAGVSPRVVLYSILGFWLFYFVLATIRALVLGFDDQLDLVWRRVFVVAAGMAITGVLYLLLRPLERATVRARVGTAALIALPAALLFAAINWYAFYGFMPVDDKPDDGRVVIREAKQGEAPGVSINGDRVVIRRGPQAPASPPASALPDESVAPAPPAPPAPPMIQIGMENEDPEKSPIVQIADGAVNYYFSMAAWLALYLALSYAAERGAAERRAAAYRAEAQTAQLRALRYQVNPHFLFNTLNSLSSLVLGRRNEDAERMILNLSTFFRSSLTTDPLEDVPLGEEIALQRLYLDVEKVRFPERLIIDIDVPAELEGVPVPGLILQPLVENAIKYGVSPARRPVTVRIAALRRGNQLHLSVEDDGDPAPGFKPEGAGVGLRNVCDRLAARFGDSARCDYGPRSGGGFGVHLVIPVVPDA